jgi:pimeloyl-ACP methyl ester carboxylesterase
MGREPVKEPKSIKLKEGTDEELTVFVYKADADKKKVVIVCHGFNSHCKDPIIKGICELLHEKGHNVVTFNFSGCEDNTEEQRDPSFTEQYRNLRTVLDEYSKGGYRIESIIGHSTGGTAAILSAAYDDTGRNKSPDQQKEDQNTYKTDRDNRIESIVLIAPRIYPAKSTMARKLEERYGRPLEKIPRYLEQPHSKDKFPIELEVGKKEHSFSKKYVQELADLDVLRALKRVKCPILVLHGNEDNIVKIEEGKTVEMECKRKNATFFPVLKADHRLYCSEHSKNTEHPDENKRSNGNKDEDACKCKRTEAVDFIQLWLSTRNNSAESWKKEELERKVSRANHLFERNYAESSDIFSLWPTRKKSVLLWLAVISLLAVFVLLPLFGPWTKLPPEMLLPIKHDDSQKAGDAQGQVALWWAVLALISGLTISYVQFINRLRKRRHDSRKKVWNFKREIYQRNVSWNMALLSWAMVFMFITICAIAYGILCSYTGLPCSEEYLSEVILYSFVISTLMRLWLVLDSHWEFLDIRSLMRR